MLKYLYCKEVFQEVPNEITLGISISGCRIRCVGCHSRDLWEDKGTPLTPQCLELLLKKHQGITCVCLFGGEHDIDSLIELFKFTKEHTSLKTAWYCGLDIIPDKYSHIKQYLDFIKIGHYDMDLGGLDSPTTNQKLWKKDATLDVGRSTLTTVWINITHLLQNHEN